MEKKQIFDTLVVVKRSGQRTSFHGEKIALAIKKAFDNVDADYSQIQVNHLYSKVLKTIEKNYQERKTIKIEDIQDIIEDQLNASGYTEVYQAFSSYREQRAASRETFVVKQQHKFLKAMESLGLDNFYDKEGNKHHANAKKSAMEILTNFGSTVSNEFAKAYLLDNKYVRAHDSGLIRIHNIEFMPMGTVASIQLELDRIFKLNKKTDSYDYVHQAFFLMQQVQKDQYGTQSIGNFDYEMSACVKTTFQQSFQQQLTNLFTGTGVLSFLNMERVSKEIEKLDTIDFPIDHFAFSYKDSLPIKRMYEIAYQQALNNTKNQMDQSLQIFFENLTTLSSKNTADYQAPTISFGTDTSMEGRLVSQSVLRILKKQIQDPKVVAPICYIKVKMGCNRYPTDPNYDLLETSYDCILQGGKIYYSFLDTSYNSDGYQADDPSTQVHYMLNGSRVIDDITVADHQVTGGKGCLSRTTINLPRIALHHGIALKERETPDLKAFFQEIEETMELIQDQLLERFEIQCSRHSYHFPVLLEQGIWLDGEKVKETDRLRKVFKHGTLEIRFVGLAEALKALTGKNHKEAEESWKLGEKIVAFLRKKVDEFSIDNNLNITLSGVTDVKTRQDLSEIDQAIFGKIKGVTDHDCYTESFHIPVKATTKPSQILILEAPFHKYTNGGHLMTLQITKSKKETIQTLLDQMQEQQVGCACIECFTTNLVSSE